MRVLSLGSQVAKAALESDLFDERSIFHHRDQVDYVIEMLRYILECPFSLTVGVHPTSAVGGSPSVPGSRPMSYHLYLCLCPGYSALYGPG